MQKKLKCCLAGLCLLAAIATPALAHIHPGDPVPTVSGWAQGEVTRARELGLIPDDGVYLPEDYREAITRRQFCMLAMNYVAFQNHCSDGFFVGLCYQMFTEQEGNPPADLLRDGNRTENMAY